ncbi:MAG: glycosyltransferase family A protein [Nitrospirae bacterium]|nr:glycosyltransferase family A protein [Nitrospirota bacterium]
MREQPPVPRRGIDLSVLFITYNRSDLLETAFLAIRERIDFGRLRVEFLVSDDASEPTHLARIRSLPFDKYVLSTATMGLGHNCNKGLAAAEGDYVLQVQDDCEFVGGRTLLATALHILRSDPDVGTVQLTHQTPGIAHDMRCLGEGLRYRIYENDGVPRLRESGARPYSDQPHVKRRQFCEDIGRYREGMTMSDMERDYQQRVACQGRWRVASIELPSGFTHLGASRSFNESHVRAKRLARLERYCVVGPIFRRLRPAARLIRDWFRETW